MSLFGVPVQRTWRDIETVEDFLIMEWPSTVIELGTGTGAFSLFLASYCAVQGARFYTFDKGEAKHPHQALNDGCRRAISALGGEIRRADIFSRHVIREIASLMTNRCFIYCDNGDKEREYATYAPLLPSGGFIAVHDFGSEINNLSMPGMEPWERVDLEGSTNRFMRKT